MEKEEISMRKLHRAVALLLTLMMVLSVLPLGAAALTVPDDQELIYFADCGADTFPSEIQTMIENSTTVENAETPDQAYDGTWGYTNSKATKTWANGTTSEEIYDTFRAFPEEIRGETMSYKFAVDAGTYTVTVGLYDPWSEWAPSRKAVVSVNGGEGQTYSYPSGAGTVVISNVVLSVASDLTVDIAPDDPSTGDQNRDALVSFIMVTRTVEQPEPEQPAMPDYVYGPGGVNWKLDVTYVCSNDSATHKGGKTEHKNFLSSGYFSFGEMENVNGTWEMDATVNAAKLLEKFFGVAHTVTENPVLRLEYLEGSGRWAIKSESSDKYMLTLTGSCANTLATPTLEDLPIWVQLYKGDYEPLCGLLLNRYPERFRNSVAIGTPYEKEGAWYCDVTLTGYTVDVEQVDFCAVSYMLNVNHYPYVCLDEYSKTITMTYNPVNSTWQAPELPKTTTHRGENDSTSQTHNGVAFLVGEPQPDAPEAPNSSNCEDFYVTVYGEEPRLDDTVVNHSLLSSRWSGYSNLVSVTFAEPTKNGDGSWTCVATVDASKMVEDQLSKQDHYRKADDLSTTKTVILTYNEDKGEWVAPSDGVTYGYPSSQTYKNGVAFKLVKQFEVTFAPGLDLGFRAPTGDVPAGGYYDAGAEVPLPDSTSLVATKGIFAGWTTTVKNGTQSTTYYYPIGTDMNEMFATDVELKAYWMDVELEVASQAYDESMAVKDHTFGDTATFSDIEDSVTVLYRASVWGNTGYPYELTCQDATPVYNTTLSGTMPFVGGTPRTYVYFTKTYTPDDAVSSETVLMGNASDSAAVSITWKESHTHTYGEPQWTWAADNSTATATFTCSSCDDVHTETATATSVTTAPTCTADGKTVYTATVSFGGKNHTDTKTVTIPATGHDYGAPQWSWHKDYTAYAVFTCANDKTHQETCKASVTRSVQKATCTRPETTTYTATVVFNGTRYQDKLVVEGYALGHRWNDGEVTTRPTASKPGERTYTCLRCGAVKYETIPATGETVVDYFWDVSAHDWFADEVTYVVEAGLMEGVGNHLFDPNGEVTRAMTWTVLARMDGEDVDGGTPWYAKARTWAMDDGVSDGTNPNNAVTREQLVTMLYRYAGSPRVYGTLTGYTDCDKVSDWAVDAMIWATDTGLIQGMGGKLNPQGTATRAQLATMLMRFVEIMK